MQGEAALDVPLTEFAGLGWGRFAEFAAGDVGGRFFIQAAGAA
jgi:hypothetical protein